MFFSFLLVLHNRRAQHQQVSDTREHYFATVLKTDALITFSFLQQLLDTLSNAKTVRKVLELKNTLHLFDYQFSE